MNKLIHLAKAINNIGQVEYATMILKLGRLSDKKYSDIARSIIEYILSDDCAPRNRFYTATTNNQFYRVTKSVMADIFQSVNFSELPKTNKNTEALSYAFELGIEIYLPLTDEDYENEIRSGVKKELLDSSLCRMWKHKAGNFNKTSYVIRLFPKPTELNPNDDSLSGKKWINEIYYTGNHSTYTTLIHEIAHAIDFKRANLTLNIGYTNSRNQDGNISTDYLNSKFEMQARLMQIFTFLRELVIQECPDLDIEKYIKSDKQKDPLSEKILSSIYNNDFVKFKDAIFNDAFLAEILRIPYIKSDKAKNRYTARLFDMFNYLRRSFRLSTSGGSGSIQNIPNIEMEDSD